MIESIRPKCIRATHFAQINHKMIAAIIMSLKVPEWGQINCPGFGG